MTKAPPKKATKTAAVKKTPAAERDPAPKKAVAPKKTAAEKTPGTKKAVTAEDAPSAKGAAAEGGSRKEALKRALVAKLRADLDVLQRAERDAREGATHDDAKPENDKDTRAIEMSYLAMGQARRVSELEEGLVEAEAMTLRAFGEDQGVALGALVTLEDEETETTRALFLAPSGGGTDLEEGAVQVVTPKSPLGQALLGKKIGDVVELRVGAKLRELVILELE